MNEKLKVRIKTYDGKKLNYETSGAVAFDVKAKQDYEIEPGETKLVDTGTSIEIPEGYGLILASRSGTFKNYGLMLINGIGIIDQDYRGNSDTLKYNYYNISKKTSVIKKGDRIGQAMLVKVLKPEFEVVSDMKNESRGGFGTTGIK
ncbi:MAG: dUTP diphosphatase [Candidatus Gracilibacteria bacterium]|nr:dUTP diphosphatase [Candidatus Gracilibacteria bacterium]